MDRTTRTTGSTGATGRGGESPTQRDATAERRTPAQQDHNNHRVHRGEGGPYHWGGGEEGGR